MISVLLPQDAPISAPVTQRMKTLVIYVVLSASWISSELTRFYSPFTKAMKFFPPSPPPDPTSEWLRRGSVTG